MQEKVEMLCKEIEEKISNITSLKDLTDLKAEYMGKKGIITELQSGIKDAENKKEYGMQVNLVRTCFNENYEAKLKAPDGLLRLGDHGHRYSDGSYRGDVGSEGYARRREDCPYTSYPPCRR